MSVHFLREAGKLICESASKSWTRLIKDQDKGKTVVTRNYREGRAETAKGRALLSQTPPRLQAEVFMCTATTKTSVVMTACQKESYYV